MPALDNGGHGFEHEAVNQMIIPAEQATDTLVVTLSRPSALLRACYYGLLLLLATAIVWASVSFVEISIHAQGIIRPAQGVHIYSSLYATMVESVYVTENQRITKGDTLISFLSGDLRAQLALSHSTIDRTMLEIADLQTIIGLPSESAALILPEYRAEYEAVQKSLRLNEVEVSSASVKHRRAFELNKKSLISEADYEEAKTALDFSEAKQAEFRRSTVSRFERDLREKQRALDELKTKHSLLQEERSKRFITANADGVVYHLTVKTGGVQVAPGQELLSLTPSDELRMEFYVPAKDIGFISERSRIRYEIETFPFQEWGMAEGSVLSISTDMFADSRTGASMFKVTGSLQTPVLHSHRSDFHATLVRGMSFTAHAVVAKKRLIDMLYDKTVPYFVFSTH